MRVTTYSLEVKEGKCISLLVFFQVHVTNEYSNTTTELSITIAERELIHI